MWVCSEVCWIFVCTIVLHLDLCMCTRSHVHYIFITKWWCVREWDTFWAITLQYLQLHSSAVMSCFVVGSHHFTDYYELWAHDWKHRPQCFLLSHAVLPISTDEARLCCRSFFSFTKSFAWKLDEISCHRFENYINKRVASSNQR